MRGLLLLLCACFASLGLVPAAWAQSGPQVDPNSPAGKEYELPIDRAREDASGGGSKGTTGTPLFGEGIDRTKSGSSSGSTSNRSSGSTSNRSRASDPDSSSSQTVDPELGTSTPRTTRAQIADGDGDSSGMLAIGGGAGGVLLIGGLAGLAWRRRSVAR